MTGTRACPECGTSLPPDAMGELCPRCLMGAAYPETVLHPPSRPAGGHRTRSEAVSLSQFRSALGELDLVDPNDLDRIASSLADLDDVPRLARVLVQSGKLTAYQAGAILQGKARGLAIGDYLVLDKIGVGGMGVVFQARDRRNGRIVALKILPPSFGRDREAVRRFQREFRIAAHLSHPSIVSAIEASEDRGVQFLTMDYIQGRNLDDLVSEQGSLPIKLALHCVIQAARGLEAAHAAGVVHRDVKPGNLMLDDAGHVRVLDLGLARVIEATSALGRSVSGTLTQSGTYMGTVDFLAPEQADDARKADHRADIYSLGCTLFYLLTGRVPFPGDTLLQRLMAHQRNPVPSIQALRPEVSDAIEGLQQRMMAKRPDDRPRTMTEVVEALESCRTSAREAGDASADLKVFARNVMSPHQTEGHEATISPGPSSLPGRSLEGPLKLDALLGVSRETLLSIRDAEDRRSTTRPRPPAPTQPRARLAGMAGPFAAVAILGIATGAYLLSTGRERSLPPNATPTSSTDDTGIETFGVVPVPFPAESPDALLGDAVDVESRGSQVESPDPLPLNLDPPGEYDMTAAVVAAVPVAMPQSEPPSPPPATPMPEPTESESRLVIYRDDFNDPESGWNRLNTEIGPGLRPIRRGYDVDQSFYYLEVPEQWMGAEAWDCTGPLASAFEVEAVGRVLGVGASPGGWGLLIVGPDSRGFQVGIDREGRVAIDPAFWGVEKYPNDPHYLPPSAHPALKPAAQWNTLSVRVRDRTLEVLVNGVRVGEPIEIEWILLPAIPEIAVFKPHTNTRIRAEFDRVEVRALPPN